MRTYDKFTIHYSCGCQYYIDNKEAEQMALCAYHAEFIIKIKSLWRGKEDK